MATGKRIQGWNAALDTPRVVVLEPTTPDVAEALEAEPVDVSWVRSNGGRAPRLSGNEAVVVDAAGLDDACDLAQRIRRVRPEAVVIAITDHADDETMSRLSESGVAEHVDRSALGQGDLARIARWAIERHRIVEGSTPTGFADPVSGLRNWRGFVAEGRREIAIAARYRLDVAVVAFGFIDLERVVEVGGPSATSAAAHDFGAALGMAVRSTDLPARTGRDEFAVLLLEAGDQGLSVVVRRVRRELERVMERERRTWSLEWAHGWASREPRENLEGMMTRARRGLERARAARLD